MSYPRASNISAYKNVAAQSMVQDAQPHELISMLLDGALERLMQAKAHIRSGSKMLKATTLHRVVQILDELSMSLNQEKGGDIARNLSGLYDYMSARLAQANLNDDVAAIDEVGKLLADIRAAWAAIAPGNQKR